jgi:predicted RNA-binding Zn ribbon-like protein
VSRPGGWPATERFALKAAPHAVGLIQDFLMTGDTEGRLRQPDLLASLDDARQWLAVARATWSSETGRSAPEVDLDEDDLAPLRKFRDALFAEVSNRSHGLTVDSSPLASHSATADIGVAADGTVSILARGRGWRNVRSWLLLEIHRSQQDNTWQRLKACKNTKCRGVFYDLSRNNSGAWHDVRTCGNVANLRASRARKRAANTN